VLEFQQAGAEKLDSDLGFERARLQAAL